AAAVAAAPAAAAVAAVLAAAAAAVLAAAAAVLATAAAAAAHPHAGSSPGTRRRRRSRTHACGACRSRSSQLTCESQALNLDAPRCSWRRSRIRRCSQRADTAVIGRERDDIRTRQRLRNRRHQRVVPLPALEPLEL